MKFFIITALLAGSSAAFAAGQCIPANEYVPFEGAAALQGSDGHIPLGTYARISPDGRFVLRSVSGAHLTTVTLMEISQKADGTKTASAYNTPLNNEAFPVQGSWRFISDVDGSHYRVKDIVQKEAKAKRQFRGGISGWYTTAAEFSGSTDQAIRIRSLSWPGAHNTDNQGVGQLQNETITVRKNADGTYSKVSEGKAYYMCNNLSSSDGNIYSLPMVSTDAMEFAAMPQAPHDGQPSMRFYRFADNNQDCLKEDNLQVATAKAIFGYPETGQKSSLVYMGSGTSNGIAILGIHYLDRNLGRSFYIGDRTKYVNPDAFPGMTRDGRVIYGAHWQDCANCPEKAGYVIADPFQSQDIKDFRQRYPAESKNIKTCITVDEVAKNQAAQALIYDLPPPK